MPTPTQIRDAIKTQIDTVSGVGTVYTKQVFAITEGAVRRSFNYATTDPDTIRGWQIMNRGMSSEELSTGTKIVDHRWTLEGFFEADEDELATVNGEADFDDIVALVVQSFDGDDTLGGLVDTIVFDGAAGVQVDRGPVETYAGALVHRAECTLITRHTE